MVQVEGSNVRFEFFRPGASQVLLVGDFTDWERSPLPMERSADGRWQARMRLPKGTFRFRYLADGQWYTDYAAFGIQYGPNGADGVVDVKA